MAYHLPEADTVNRLTILPRGQRLGVTRFIAEEERGRVFSFQSMQFKAGALPVLLFAGVIADILGVEIVMYVLAAAILAFSVPPIPLTPQMEQCYATWSHSSS